MDKAAKDLLASGRKFPGFGAAPGVDDALLHYADLLLKWNQKVNLTAVTDPSEVVEKHLLDCLAAVPFVGPARSALDLGSGAGLPGLVFALACPGLEVVMVDSVQKKVGFLKAAAASLGVAARARGVHTRAEGQPEQEGLPRVDLVVSRAFQDVERFVPLAARYLLPGGRVLAMLGRLPEAAVLERVAAASGLTLEQARPFALPFSQAPRAVAVFQAAGATGL